MLKQKSIIFKSQVGKSIVFIALHWYFDSHFSRQFKWNFDTDVLPWPYLTCSRFPTRCPLKKYYHHSHPYKHCHGHRHLRWRERDNAPSLILECIKSLKTWVWHIGHPSSWSLTIYIHQPSVLQWLLLSLLQFTAGKLIALNCREYEK